MFYEIFQVDRKILTVNHCENMCESTYKTLILQAIDQLRQRKARPDFERICHMLSRREGMTAEDIGAQLAKLVNEGVVAKVDYKGNTSYRNMAKWSKRGRKRTIKMNSKRRIVDAIKALCSEKDGDTSISQHTDEPTKETVTEDIKNCASSSEDNKNKEKRSAGVSLEEIEEYLHREDASTVLAGDGLVVLLDKLIEAKAVVKVSASGYVLADEGQHDSLVVDVEKSGLANMSSSSPSGGSSVDDNSVSPVPTSPAVVTLTKVPARRGRPPGRGKKV